MTTKELIKKLKLLDPDGDMEVKLDDYYYGYPITDVYKFEYTNENTGETICWLEIR